MVPDRTLSVAPMMEWTDRHYRRFVRCLTRHTLLYTEMVTALAVVNGDKQRLLGFSETETPLALQLGGSDPDILSRAAKIGEDWGYDEINLNVGCPSDRVQEGRFGACLMAEPELVARCIEAMMARVNVPVTVKCRIGIDDRDSYDELCHFIETVSQAGCQSFTVHARKAWLKGLSPKENREIPPLDYTAVYRLKSDFPKLEFVINGGILSLSQVDEQLNHVDGVMIGREAYNNPFILAEADRRYFQADSPQVSRHEALQAYFPYVERELAQGVPLNAMTRHLMGLFHGLNGARSWRRHLSLYAKSVGTLAVLQQAADFVDANQSC